ncbi:MAG: hypothetical protein IJJ33_13310 [Victivallales bacterium]|nr:hypothetical protein [Victivallales bacterium]
MEDLKAQLEQTAAPWLGVNETRNQILLSVQFHGICTSGPVQPSDDEVSLALDEDSLPFCRLLYSRLQPSFLAPAPDPSRMWLVSADGCRLRQCFLGTSSAVSWHAFADDQATLPAQPFAGLQPDAPGPVQFCLHLPALKLLGHTRVFPKLAEKDFLVFRPLADCEGLKAWEARPPLYLLSLPGKEGLQPERARERALTVAELELNARQCLLKHHSQRLLSRLDAVVRQLLEQTSVPHLTALDELSHLWLASDLGMLPGVHVSLLKKLCITCDDLTMAFLGKSHATGAPVATDRLRAHLLRQCLTN